VWEFEPGVSSPKADAVPRWKDGTPVGDELDDSCDEFDDSCDVWEFEPGVSSPMDPRFAATEYVVMASGEEANAFWLRWNTIIPIDSQPSGLMTTIGSLAGYPITADVIWHQIAGKLVAFVGSSSRVVDYTMLDEWVTEVFPCVKWRHRKTDISNVNHMVAEVVPDWDKDPEKRARFKLINALLLGTDKKT
jgi:hypothetical protein